ncbi:alpha/beta hydrolase [Oceanobacillus sp. FSL K6-3682]|uniref:alpha/beta hydrolase n=1 Tax=Oceanobacillus sp. FSL K6-3682 TaxID=2921503 RepID=UPI0030DBBEAF
MGKIVRPKPFFLKGGERAVLLLHSFTSSTVDMKKLGRFLNQENYTCFAPLYKGHGLSAEQLILTGPDDWCGSVEAGYHFLKNEGYQNIAVIGISLGGILALNTGQKWNVNGIVTMSAPYQREVNALKRRVQRYARTYKQLEGKSEQQISYELNNLEENSLNSLIKFEKHIDLTMEELSKIDKPISIYYGELDEPLYKESADYIYRNVSSENKILKRYSNSRHIMLADKDQEQIQADILSFLNNLQW